MNKRITDLHNQAITFSSKNGGLRISSHIPNDYIEKFAEMIIRECIAKVSEWDMGITDPVGVTDNTSEVARNMISEIKQHFGVEE